MSERFEVRESKNLGRGLFATRFIKKGDQILEFAGQVIFFKEVLDKELDQQSNPLQIGPTEYIDIEEPGVFANHSCSPNAGIKDDRFLVAIKDIPPGQEICYDYSTTMDEEHWTLECKCESPDCRHTVKDFKYLPPEVQASYIELNIVQSFIRRKLNGESGNFPWKF